MDRFANVRSIDALEKLAAALRSFAEEATVALEELGMDVHRAIQWVQYEQKEYWSAQLLRAQEAVQEAKLCLERKRMFRVGDTKPSCHEEQLALDAAKRRLELTRQKLEAVRRWTRLLGHESMECKSGVAPLAHWLQTDVPRALAVLKRMQAALESYVGLQSSAEAPPALEGTAPGAEITEEAWQKLLAAVPPEPPPADNLQANGHSGSKEA